VRAVSVAAAEVPGESGADATGGGMSLAPKKRYRTTLKIPHDPQRRFDLRTAQLIHKLLLALQHDMETSLLFEANNRLRLRREHD
jgi:hypothetical protein